MNLKACFSDRPAIARNALGCTVMVSGHDRRPSGRDDRTRRPSLWITGVAVDCSERPELRDGGTTCDLHRGHLGSSRPPLSNCHPNNRQADGVRRVHDKSRTWTRVGGEYSPQRLAQHRRRGCCGRTPETIQMIARRAEASAPGFRPARR